MSAIIFRSVLSGTEKLRPRAWNGLNAHAGNFSAFRRRKKSQFFCNPIDSHQVQVFQCVIIMVYFSNSLSPQQKELIALNRENVRSQIANRKVPKRFVVREWYLALERRVCLLRTNFREKLCPRHLHACFATMKIPWEWSWIRRLGQGNYPARSAGSSSKLE